MFHKAILRIAVFSIGFGFFGSAHSIQAQTGTVLDEQKINTVVGGFLGVLDDGDKFGLAITSLGDLDSDGVPDLAVGAPNDDDGDTNVGAVWILFFPPVATVE